MLRKTRCRVKRAFVVIGLASCSFIAGDPVSAQDLAQQKLAEARRQVEDGIEFTRYLRASVFEFYVAKGQWPGSLAAVGNAGPISSATVQQVTLTNGTITVRFSPNAAPGIAGKVVALRPTILPYKAVHWTCGYAASEGAEPATGQASRIATTINATYLPARCQ
jgi:hypothetical protein